MFIAALFISIVSALLWIYEINQGISNAEDVISKASILNYFMVGPRVIMGFLPFIFDLLITGFFLTFFMVSGVTGFIVGVAVSDIFSIWIILKMNKGTSKGTSN